MPVNLGEHTLKEMTNASGTQYLISGRRIFGTISKCSLSGPPPDWILCVACVHWLILC